ANRQSPSPSAAATQPSGRTTRGGKPPTPPHERMQDLTPVLPSEIAAGCRRGTAVTRTSLSVVRVEARSKQNHQGRTLRPGGAGLSGRRRDAGADASGARARTEGNNCPAPTPKECAGSARARFPRKRRPSNRGESAAFAARLRLRFAPLVADADLHRQRRVERVRPA